jgi:alpha-beta hydrolase superfamily lysophospholipase
VKRLQHLQPIPTLLMLGGQDRIIRNDATREWLQRVSSQSQVMEYPNAHHTLEFEPGQPFVADLLAWLGK